MTQRGFHVTQENLHSHWLEPGRTQRLRLTRLAVTRQHSSDGAVLPYHATWPLFSPSGSLKETAPSCCAVVMFFTRQWRDRHFVAQFVSPQNKYKAVSTVSQLLFHQRQVEKFSMTAIRKPKWVHLRQVTLRVHTAQLGGFTREPKLADKNNPGVRIHRTPLVKMRRFPTLSAAGISFPVPAGTRRPRLLRSAAILLSGAEAATLCISILLL